MLTLWDLFCLLQAYTSQFVALIMFALLMCDDRISVQPRRREIIQGLKVLPGKCISVTTSLGDMISNSIYKHGHEMYVSLILVDEICYAAAEMIQKNCSS